MKREYLTRKENLVLTAIEIINDIGIQGLTIRELANCEDITEGAIYRHFKNKNEIVLAVLDQFSSFDSTIVRVIKEQNMSAKEGIIFLFKSFAEYYENYPALTSIEFIYDFIKNEDELAKRMKQIFDYKFETLTDIISQGKKNNEITGDISPEELADIILGIKKQMVFRWRLNDYNFELKDRMVSAVAALIKLF